jgi:hypothetical protein
MFWFLQLKKAPPAVLTGAARQAQIWRRGRKMGNTQISLCGFLLVIPKDHAAGSILKIDRSAQQLASDIVYCRLQGELRLLGEQK